MTLEERMALALRHGPVARETGHDPNDWKEVFFLDVHIRPPTPLPFHNEGM